MALGKFRGFSLTGFYNRACDSGNNYFVCANLVDALGSYSYLNENQEYSSSFGVKLAHDGGAQDASSPPSTSPLSTLLSIGPAVVATTAGISRSTPA